MPETTVLSPATTPSLSGNFRRPGPAADGGTKPLKFNGTLRLRGGTPARPVERPTKIARFRNTLQPCNMTICPSRQRPRSKALHGTCVGDTQRPPSSVPSCPASRARPRSRLDPRDPRPCAIRASARDRRRLRSSHADRREHGMGVELAGAGALDGIPPFSMRVGTCVLREPLRSVRHRVSAGKRPASSRRSRGCTSWSRDPQRSVLLGAYSVCPARDHDVSRVVLTMPIWAALFARRPGRATFDVMRGISLVLCVSGTAVLVYPLLGSSDPDRTCTRLGNGGVLGGRHGVLEVGADRR